MSETETRSKAPQSQPVPKSWIAAIHAYVPGKSAGKDGRPLIKLSANENPLGTSEAALAARAQVPSLYPDPDCQALRAKLGEMHGIDPERVVMGTGSRSEVLRVGEACVRMCRAWWWPLH